MNQPAQHSVASASAATAVPPGPLPRTGKHDPLARQRAVVAMGRRAIAPPDVSILTLDAAALLAEMLDVEHSGAAEIGPDGASQQLRLTLGGAGPLAGQTQTVAAPPGSRDSLAGFVLQVAHPVAVCDLAKERRFYDAFLREQGIRSALAIPLKTQDRSFGSLAAYSSRVRQFDDDDVLFVETIAHLVATTIARHHAEESLAQERRHSAVLLQTVDAIVLTLDPRGLVVDVNPAFQRITGFSSSDARNRPVWSTLATPEDAETFRGMLSRLSGSTISVDFESRVLTKQAERRQIAWSCRALFDGGGQIESVIATGIDVTQRRESEEQTPRADVADGGETAASDPTAAEPGLFQPMPVPAGAERRKRPRRSYPYTQSIAYFAGDTPPAEEDFFPVRCIDIAAGGFSFLSRTPPPNDNLVVSLGTPPKVTKLAALVAHVTRTDRHGQHLYLVGCSYTGRAPQ
jgi:PAS domain S-box-containing protein